MYVLFAAIPFVGHLNPLLRQAEELQRRGWRVAVAVHRERTEHVRRETGGLPTVDLGALGPIADRLRACEEAASADPDYTRGAMTLMPLMTEPWPSTFDGLTAAIARERPDLMVVDLFTSAGFSAAEAAGVPFIVNNPALLPSIPSPLLPPAPGVPFMATGRSIHSIRWWHRACEPLTRHVTNLVILATLGRRLHALRASRGLRGSVIELLRRTTILVNGVFGLEYERPLPENVHLVGPMLPACVPAESPELMEWLSLGPPVVYANLGTVASAPASQMAKMAAAFAGDGFRVLWVMRGAVRERLPSTLAPNIRTVGWIESPRAVLAHPNVCVFVSHCGINSVYESMAAGTPIVGIPMLSDQRDMAVRVADAGAGLWVDKSRFTAAELRSAIDRVRLEPGFRARVASIRRAIEQSGGITRAADLIEAHARVA